MIYTRISDDKTGEALGVERQESACRALCEQRGWGVTELITENDTSATKGRRQGFARLLEMIERRAADVVVVWAADRLVRRLTELENLIDLCERHGVRIATVSGDLDLSTDAGRLVARILTSVARAEVERKSARQSAALRQAVVAGKPTGGRRAYGYTADGLHLDPVEAPVVQEMFERFNGGATLGDLCRLLAARGILTPQGRPWSTTSVRLVLLNPRYAALRGVRWLASDEDGRPKLNAAGQRQREQFHQVVGRAVWPRVVDEAVWRAASDQLRDPERRKNYRGHTPKYLLSGLTVCAVEGCERRLKTKVNNQERAFACPEFRHVCRKASVIEAFVTDVVIERLRREDAVDLLRPTGPGIDVRALRDESEAIRARLRDLARAEVLGQRTADEVEAGRAAARERLEEIDQAVADAARGDVVAAFVADGRDPAEVWAAASLGQRRELIKALMVVRVGSGRVGRPAKYSAGQPPVNVHVEWLRTAS